MKVIKNGVVYDIGYGHYETVCELPFGWKQNEVGNFKKATKELRKDKDSGRYYVLTSSSDWDRASTVLCPCTKEEAMSIAEDFLDYERFVQFFGDPEGELSEAKRAAAAAVSAQKSADENKNYWYAQSEEKSKKIKELESKIAELEGEIASLKANA